MDKSYHENLYICYTLWINTIIEVIDLRIDFELYLFIDLFIST